MHYLAQLLLHVLKETASYFTKTEEKGLSWRSSVIIFLSPEIKTLNHQNTINVI